MADSQVQLTSAHEADKVDGEQLAGRIASLSVGQETPAEQVPRRRQAEPQYDQRRVDPFLFGSRYLQDEDDVFEFNAWDHVETDDAHKEYAEKQYELQRQSPVSDFERRRVMGDPAKFWDVFYKNNSANFFKNRKWLHQEFPILGEATSDGAGPMTLLEIGAGAGNTAFPILAKNQNPQLRLHACDFSKTAVDVMRGHEQYDPKHIQADVWDVAGDALPPGLAEGSVDIVLMIFIFSALSPAQWVKAVSNVYRLLKPGGLVCFRDYGRGDLAQIRFRKGRYLEENFYVRGDGTRVYFFDQDELAEIWKRPLAATTSKSEEVVQASSPLPPPQQLFDIEQLGIDRRLLVNRARKLKMYRCWLQGRFRKK